MLRIYLVFSILLSGLSLNQVLAANPSGFSLVGVITDYNDKQSIAVISTSNRQTLFLHVGDQLPGMQSYRISQISRNQVILSDGRQEMRLEHSGTSAGGSSSGLASNSSAFSDRGGMTWNDDPEAMILDGPDYQDGLIIDDYRDSDLDEMGARQNTRARQIPGLILRNRGQAIDDPSYGYDE